MARVLLFGLEFPSEIEIRRVLVEEGHEVRSETPNLDAIDVVFCNGDGPDYRFLVQRIRDIRPDLPVVVVTRLPDATKWLDALEAGAADYCSAPFETVQLRWLLSAVLRGGTPAAALSPAESY